MYSAAPGRSAGPTKPTFSFMRSTYSQAQVAMRPCLAAALFLTACASVGTSQPNVAQHALSRHNVTLHDGPVALGAFSTTDGEVGSISLTQVQFGGHERLFGWQFSLQFDDVPGVLAPGPGLRQIQPNSADLRSTQASGQLGHGANYTVSWWSLALVPWDVLSSWHLRDAHMRANTTHWAGGGAGAWSATMATWPTNSTSTHPPGLPMAAGTLAQHNLALRVTLTFPHANAALPQALLQMYVWDGAAWANASSSAHVGGVQHPTAHYDVQFNPLNASFTWQEGWTAPATLAKLVVYGQRLALPHTQHLSEVARHTLVAGGDLAANTSTLPSPPLTVVASPAAAGQVLPSIGQPLRLACRARVVQMSGSQPVACALLADGRLKCWGGSAHGVLGLAIGPETIGDNETPRQVGFVRTGGSVQQVGVGNFVTCVLLRESGKLRCWGQMRRLATQHSSSHPIYGSAVGDDEHPDALPPIHTEGNLTFHHISVNYASACALATLPGENIFCWGTNQGTYPTAGSIIGDTTGEYIDSFGPVHMGGMHAIHVAVGRTHICAVRADGSVVCWGTTSANGRLGLGFRPSGHVNPLDYGTVDLGEYNHSAVAVAAGQEISCVVYSTAEAFCWGSPDAGLLNSVPEGQNIGEYATPAQQFNGRPVGNVGRPVVGISVYLRSTCMLFVDGDVLCSGPMGNGMGGNILQVRDTDTSSSEPAHRQPVAASAKFFHVFASHNYACGVQVTGAAVCWGSNAADVLGYNGISGTYGRLQTDTEGTLSIHEDTDVCASTCTVDGDGLLTSCAVAPHSTVAAAGAPSPSWSLTVPGGIVDLQHSYFTTCVLLEDGNTRCWGVGSSSAHGNLFNGHVGDNEFPSAGLFGLWGEPARQMATAAHMICVLTASGGIRCAGTAARHGYNTTDYMPKLDGLTPAEWGDWDLPPGLDPVRLVSGYHGVSIIDSQGRLWRTGTNTQGKLGAGLGLERGEFVGDKGVRLQDIGPVQLPGPVLDAVSGATQVCVILQDSHNVTCWGYLEANILGAGMPRMVIGDDNTPLDFQPVNVGEGIQIAAAQSSLCVLRSNGTVWCWGSTDDGMLGQPGVPFEVELPPDDPLLSEVRFGGPVVQVSCLHTVCCAVRTDGALFCWGRSSYGATGSGSTLPVGQYVSPEDLGPVDLGGASTAFVRVGKDITCAVLHAGDVSCFGDTEYGNAGLASTEQIFGSQPPAHHRARVWESPLTLPAQSTLRGVAADFFLEGTVAAPLPLTRLRCLQCDTSGLLGLPPFFVQALHSTVELDLPLSPAQLGVQCLSVNLPLSEQKGGLTPLCVWPEDWQAQVSALGLVGATAFSIGVNGAATAQPTGGEILFVQGSWWAVSLFEVKAAPVNVTLCGLPCLDPRISTAAQQLTCQTPPLSGHNHSCDVAIYHTVPGAPSPTILGFQVVYTPPSISSLSPSRGVSIFGQRIAVQGSALGLPRSDSGFGVPLSAVQVTVADLPCANISHISGNLLHCDAPPLFGRAAVNVTIAGQAAPSTFIEYAVPELESVSPTHAVTAHTSSPASSNFTIQGQHLGRSAGDLSITIAGVPCPAVQWLGPDAVACLELPLSQLSQGSLQADVTVAVGGVHEAKLFAAVRVYTAPVLFAASPLPFPQTGGELTIDGAQLGRASWSHGALQGGDVENITVVISGRVTLCSNHSVSDSQVTCTLPPGVGLLGPIRLRRVGGLVATLALPSLKYEPGTITSVAPSYLMQPPPAVNVTVNITVSGVGFGAAPQQSALAVELFLGDTPCLAPLHINSTTLMCVDQPTQGLAWGGRLGISGRVSGTALQSTGAYIQAYSHPEVDSVLPPVLSAAGGTRVVVLGSNFGRAEADVAAITIGGAPCGSVRHISDTRVSCLMPPQSATAGQANIVLTSRHGAVAAPAGDAVSFAAPQVYLVRPDEVLHGAPGAALRYNVTVYGLSLGNPSLPFAGHMALAGADCEEGGGTVELSPDARSMQCRDILASYLPRSALQALAAVVTVTTNENLTVASDQGSFKVLPPPQVLSITPALARAGDTVSVLGLNLGWEDADVVGVDVGLVPAPAFERIGQGGLTLTLPPALSTADEHTANLTVNVRLISGWNTAGQGTARVAYDRDALPPASAPTHLCGYRDAADNGATRVEFQWVDDGITRTFPVRAWRIQFSTVPWMAGGAVQEVVLPNVPSEDLLSISAPHTLCNIARDPLEPGSRRFSARLQAAPVDGTSIWVRVAGVTDLGRVNATSGPLSPPNGPIMAVCRDDEYLATQFAARGQWAQALCQRCPVGATCNGLPWEAMTNVPGFFRVPWSEDMLSFEACLAPFACTAKTSTVHLHELAYVLPAATGTIPAARQLSNSSEGGITTVGAHVWFGLPAAYAGMRVVDDQVAVVPGAGRGQQITAQVVLRSAPEAQETPACLAGHEGVLCGKCEVGRSLLSTGECRECGSQALAAGLLALTYVCLLGVVLLLIRSQLLDSGAETKDYSVMRKILINHLQQLALMLNFDFAWPEPLRGALGLADAASSAGQELASPDCFRSTESANAVDSAFRLRTLGTLLLPITFILAALALWGALRACGRIDRREFNRRASISTALISFLFYTPLVRTTMQMFTCVRVGGDLRLQMDLDVECGGAGNSAWALGLGLPMMLLIVVGLPATIGAVLFRFRTALWTNDRLRTMLGLFYLGYAKDRYWYEVVIMARKALFAIAMVFLGPHGLLYQISVALLVLLCFLVTGQHLQPYRQPLFNVLDEASLVLSMVTLAGGISMIRRTAVGQPTQLSDSSTLLQGVTVTLTFVNTVFVAGIVLWMLRTWYATDGAKHVLAAKAAVKRPGGLPTSGKLLRSVLAKRPSTSPLRAPQAAPTAKLATPAVARSRLPAGSHDADAKAGALAQPRV